MADMMGYMPCVPGSLSDGGDHEMPRWEVSQCPAVYLLAFESNCSWLARVSTVMFLARDSTPATPQS